MSRRPSWFSNWDPATRLLLRQGFVGVLVAMFVILLLVGVWHGTRISSLTITTVASHDGPTIDASAIEAQVSQQLEGTYFRLIPRRFAWLYPEQDITQALMTNERIRSAAVSVHNGTKLVVDFTEHIPVALWCTENRTAACLFINDVGYAFTEAPQLRGGSFMRYVTPNRAPTLGEVMASPVFLADTDWFMTQLDEVLQLYPERVHLYKDGRATYELANGGDIMVSSQYDPVDTFRYLETLLQSDEYSELREEEFQYIDLRFGNKLFVNRTPATTTASSTETSDGNATPVVLSSIVTTSTGTSSSE